MYNCILCQKLVLRKRVGVLCSVIRRLNAISWYYVEGCCTGRNMDCDSAPMNPASYALYPESMMASWNMEDRAFHAFGFHCFLCPSSFCSTRSAYQQIKWCEIDVMFIICILEDMHTEEEWGPRIDLFIIHQIFSLARDWSKRVTWANIPQLKLGNI